MPSKSRAGNRGGRLPRNNSPRVNVNSNSVRYSLQDNTQCQYMELRRQLIAAAWQQLWQEEMHEPQIQQQHYLPQQEHPPQQHEFYPQPIHQPHYVQPNCIIRPSQHPHCLLPPYVDPNQIQQIIENTPVSEEYTDITRILIIRENGEQFLITCHLPKEGCTIEDILQATGIPFHPDSNIEFTETCLAGLNYLVSIGTQNNEE